MTLGLRATSRMSTEVSVQRNDVDLPWGAFVVNLGIVKFDYPDFRSSMTLRGVSGDEPAVTAWPAMSPLGKPLW